MVKIKVKNIGDAPTTFDGDNQTMINKRVRSSPPTLRSTSTWRTKRFLEEINPGQSGHWRTRVRHPQEEHARQAAAQGRCVGFSEGMIVDVS
jgi:hypothetical protein